jgi:hypothetical protein
MLRRLALVLALAVSFWSGPAAASGHAAAGGEIYQKLEMLILEMWDNEGVFHMVAMEMQAVFNEPPKMEKGMMLKAKQMLQSMPYEELTKPNGPSMIKGIMLQLIRAQPGGEGCRDVLITKLMFR